jgi:hypothetical protein
MWDGHFLIREDMLLESIDRIRVTVDEALPEGTVEPVRLTFRATTGERPDGFGVLPLTYDLLGANAILPGIHLTQHDQTVDPVVEAGPPVRAFDPDRAISSRVPF